MAHPHALADSASVGRRQPHRNLLVYYFLQSLLLGPLFPVLLLPRYFKFRSLRYHLGEDGIAAAWGVLFRHEVSLGYGRIQDIHLASNVVERWLGIARIEVQTASGSSGAELTIEGLPDYAAVRDWIYMRMRGAAKRRAPAAAAAPVVGSSATGTGDGVASAAVVGALREVAAELRRVRELLERTPGDGAPGPHA